MQQATDEIAEKFKQLLSHNNVQSGEALQNAKSIYEQLDRQNKINETLPKAWNKIISNGDARLYDLLSDTTESICGFRPDDKDVERMFAVYKTNLMLPETPFEKVPSKKDELKSFGITKYTVEGSRLIENFLAIIGQKRSENWDKI